MANEKQVKVEGKVNSGFVGPELASPPLHGPAMAKNVPDALTLQKAPPIAPLLNLTDAQFYELKRVILVAGVAGAFISLGRNPATPDGAKALKSFIDAVEGLL